MQSLRRTSVGLILVLAIGAIMVACVAVLHSWRTSYGQRNVRIVREIGRIGGVRPVPTPVTSDYTSGVLNLRTGYRTEAAYTFSKPPTLRRIGRLIRGHLGDEWRQTGSSCLINPHGELVAYGFDVFDRNVLEVLVDAKGEGLCDDYTSILES